MEIRQEPGRNNRHNPMQVALGQEDNEPRCLVEGLRRVLTRRVRLHFHHVVRIPHPQRPAR